MSYASSSMMQVIERHSKHSDISKLDHPQDPRLHVDTYNNLCKEVSDKTCELSHLRGANLQGLTIQELQKLEELLKTSLFRVSKEKDARFMKEISVHKTKVNCTECCFPDFIFLYQLSKKTKNFMVQGISSSVNKGLSLTILRGHLMAYR